MSGLRLTLVDVLRELRLTLARFVGGTRREWVRIVVGAATGMWVATGLCMALVLVVNEYGYPVGDYTLAFVLDGILIAGPYVGALVGYRGRS